MAFLKQPKSEEEVRTLSPSALRKDYNDLASEFLKITEGSYMYCHHCNEFLSKTTFYSDNRYASGCFPVCKKCILAMVEQRKKKNDKPNETKDSVKSVLVMMDLPYIDSFYEDCIKGALDDTRERTRSSPFVTYITSIKSLPQYRGKTWKDSEFEYNPADINAANNRKPRKEIYKIFGSGFSNEDYLYLQDQYDDWKNRTKVDSKSQELYIIRICFKQLDIWKAQRSGKDTTTLDKSLNDLMAAANLQPKQNVGNAATDSLTFGQLIEKWELEKPIPEPSEEFKDVDGIGKYIRVWFKGHLARALGLDNGYSEEYDDYVQQYTVTKAGSQEEGESEDIYNKLFGTVGE